MKYTVRCGKRHQIGITRAANVAKDIDLQIGKKSFNVNIKDVNADGTIRTVTINNKIYPVVIEKNSEGFPIQVTLNGIPIGVNIEKVESTRYKPKTPDRKISGEVMSALPGQVITVLVQKGDRVKKGQPLLIQESMKMENEILAPKSGVVSKILVKKDQVVMKNHKLIEIS